jgi:hypothetical protein
VPDILGVSKGTPSPSVFQMSETSGSRVTMRFGLPICLRGDDPVVTEIRAILIRLSQQQEKFMADVSAELASVKTQLDAVAAALPGIATAVASIQAALAALQNSTTSTLSATDQATLDGINADAGTIATAVTGLSTQVAPPAPPATGP